MLIKKVPIMVDGVHGNKVVKRNCPSHRYTIYESRLVNDDMLVLYEVVSKVYKVYSDKMVNRGCNQDV